MQTEKRYTSPNSGFWYEFVIMKSKYDRYGYIYIYMSLKINIMCVNLEILVHCVETKQCSSAHGLVHCTQCVCVCVSVCV